MRLAIGILLLLNLVLALWQVFFDKTLDAPVTEPPPDIGAIQLLSEEQATTREASQMPAEPVAVPAAKPEPEPTPNPSPIATKPAVPVEVAAPEESQPPPSLPPSAVVKQEPKQERSLPDAPTQWVRRCIYFSTAESEQEALQKIASNLRTVEVLGVTEQEVERTAGYFVLVPPAADRASAAQTKQALAEIGFKDVWVFSGGSLANAISLGMFSRKANADALADSTRNKGFDVEVRPNVKTETHYVVQMRLNDEELAKLESSEIEGLESVECP